MLRLITEDGREEPRELRRLGQDSGKVVVINNKPERKDFTNIQILKEGIFTHIDLRLEYLKFVGDPGSVLLSSARQLPISAVYLKYGRYLKSALDIIGRPQVCGHYCQ